MANHVPTLRIQIPLLWLSITLFGIVELALLYAYHHADKHWQDTIVFGASIVAGGFALFSYMKNIEEKRRAAASRIIERWNNPMMAPFRDVMRDIRAGKQSVEPLKRPAKEYSFPPDINEVRGRMQALLGFYEDMCLAIRLKAADEKFLQLYFAAVIIQSYKKTLSWIEHERTVDDQRSYYREFQNIAEKWMSQGE